MCNIFEAHLFEWHGNQLAHGSLNLNTWPLQTYFVLLLFLCMCLSKTEWTSAASDLFLYTVLLSVVGFGVQCTIVMIMMFTLERLYWIR